MENVSLVAPSEYLEHLLNNVEFRTFLVSKGHLKSVESVSPAEVIAVLKLVCEAASIACPIINSL